MWTHLLFTVVLASVSESKIQKQCLCEPYKKCEEKFKPATNFKRCMRNCKERVDGDVPESYFECLSQFNHVLTKTLKCTYEAVGTGCSVFMPNELRLLDNLTKCALKSDVSRGIMMEIATCMSWLPAKNC
ncbi:hypothetical protein NECAME_02941 [Necator americanus]|uniref:Chondroitin proteoglycan 4 domain-containing protein n=1 Tax=Necator americanus TaxID=51031 RepID=W2T897_NECAM|nr:hypothetical protein NECAME_02941 [Necator americanus]ETN78235.1 hypothetical protein NECAME_02941 [Necator americanus]